MREAAWNTLENIGDLYGSICRMLRNQYKWSPNVVDSITVDRLLKIVEETIEDAEKNSTDFDD